MEMKLQWAIIYILTVVAVNGEEPKSDRFGYETQLLEKVIRMEIKEERMESEIQTTKQQVEESLQTLRREREALSQDYETLKTIITSDMREIKDEFKFATDGGWSAWSNWTDCTVTCLGGLTRRTRTCNNPEPTRFGHSCVGNDEEVDICNSVMCPDIDDCTGHSCKNGATCVDGVFTYTCNCASGYTGEDCSTDIDECACSTCQNGATCVDGVAKYTCVCPTGYTDELCETIVDINKCSSEPCKNEATCVDGIANYSCQCGPGYKGVNCETNINECLSDPCKNGATCVDGVANYSCLCGPGYTGVNCETRIDSCRKVASDNGIYKIYPASQPFAVFCDQTTDGGGWIVLQRRKDGSVHFERSWADYKSGFGDLEGEFWLGNDNIHVLTAAGFNELRVDLEDFAGSTAYAKYSNFDVKSESDKYSLTVSGYSGDAGDSLTYHNRMQFSTEDRDNDKNSGSCSEMYRGAWWYSSCHNSNLNGFYYHGAGSPSGKGVNWYHWKGYEYSLKFVEMKIR